MYAFSSFAHSFSRGEFGVGAGGFSNTIILCPALAPQPAYGPTPDALMRMPVPGTFYAQTIPARSDRQHLLLLLSRRPGESADRRSYGLGQVSYHCRLL
jgi:hypothetical protein